ncbi:hypothetical protein [Streptomyces spiramenti]|uniref:Integral membrane protein n=1 Tax=Streptomyces spiramenti TaxID=2720606 RepID=A0ABX1ANH5_9ACTN|nr:hypothetical protein [Streptomyces spiramenti]NJP67176.1 hypothetical protein [Streptomyces spiramenti]
MSYGDDYDDASERGIPSQTRTHYPDEEPGDRARRGGPTPRRNLTTIVGVFLILIAAIVFANRAGDDGATGGAADGDSSRNPGPAPTAPSGESPVDSAADGIPSGFPQTQQGAESAAANYAVALGGEGMFATDTRHSIVDALYEPDAAERLKAAQDSAYSQGFLERLGLDGNGQAPAGMTFVSRTVPVGTTAVAYDDETATVEVWYTALIGMAGEGSRDPIRTDWKTWTFDLSWTGEDWQVVADSQVEGPAPVPGDLRASPADEIADAVGEFGGFTYAR